MGVDEVADESGTGNSRERVVDARAAQGVQVGDHNTQVIYHYHGTWTDGVAPAPLIGVAGSTESPYRGLGWFTERDAPFFFGRDTAIDAVLQRLSQCVQQPGILMVSGVSGAGKSSLLQAGVLPLLRGQGLNGVSEAHAWPRQILKVGHAPLEELAVAIAQLAGLDAATVRRELRQDPVGFAALAAQAAGPASASDGDGARGLLLVVDQFEQLFTQCPDEQQRQAFLTALHAAATSRHAGAVVLVALVVREDFEARCGDYEQLVDAVQHRYLVTAMTEEQLKLAIIEPAKRAGARIDADLRDHLLREILTRTADSVSAATSAAVSRAGVLPLLSYALDQAWRHRTSDTVTLADYERSGGLEGAVAVSAQNTYDSLSGPQQRAARRVFTRLVISGSDGVETADRVHYKDLLQGSADPGDIDAVLEAFTRERLLTQGAGWVEISHEVLLSAWPLLRDTWLGETRDNRAVCARLRGAAKAWKQDSRDPAHLYSGSVLDAAVAAAEQVKADPARYVRLTEAETQFLDASVRAQRRRSRQRRTAVGILIALVVALAASTLVAFHANQESAHQRDAAMARYVIGQSQLLATSDPGGSRLSALAAWSIDPTPEARYAMLAAARNRATAKLTFRASVDSVVFSPDNKTLATSGRGVVWLWDVASRQQIGEPLTDRADSVAFSPDSKTLATGGYDGTVRLWDVANQRQIGELLTKHTSSIEAVTFSPDGKTLATTGNFNGIRLWDVASRQQDRRTTHRTRIWEIGVAEIGGVQPQQQDPRHRQRRRGPIMGRSKPAADRRTTHREDRLRDFGSVQP